MGDQFGEGFSLSKNRHETITVVFLLLAVILHENLLCCSHLGIMESIKLRRYSNILRMVGQNNGRNVSLGRCYEASIITNLLTPLPFLCVI